MGGRGSNFGGSDSAGVTTAQNKTINRLARQTRDLKNEQYRIVNEDGDVVLEKKGTKHQVNSTVGEKREFMEGAVSIHNHPDGGTFSEPDLRDFGFGARQIVAASPEGTYKLTNMEYGTRNAKSGWHDMSEAMERAGVTKEISFTELRKQAQSQPAVARQMKAMQKTSDQWVRAREAGKSQATLDRLAAQYDRQNAAALLKSPYDAVVYKNGDKVKEVWVHSSRRNSFR